MPKIAENTTNKIAGETMDINTSTMENSKSYTGLNGFKLNNREFGLFRDFMYQKAGVYLGPAKLNLVANRLSNRLRYYKISSYEEYFELAVNNLNKDEQQLMIHLLTTHETHFFREAKHFDCLERHFRNMQRLPSSVHIWSAGCSSGQEVYTLAMVLENLFGYDRSWEIVGTDISKETIKIGVSGLYPESQLENIPRPYQTKHCLKGKGKYQGFFLFDKMLRSRTRFTQHNLNDGLHDFGQFDAVFLRNVMIYFDDQVKKKLIERMTKVMKPGALLFIGCSESLTRRNKSLVFLEPGVYQLHENKDF